MVVAGTFLVDSESRLRLAGQGAVEPRKAAAEKDPVCGMDAEPAEGRNIEYRGQHYSFCSDSCKQKFQKEPARYLKERTAGASPSRIRAAA